MTSLLTPRGVPPHLISLRESLYLDVARVLASLAVLVDHAMGVFNLSWAIDLGHQAVVVFFVLSGYVISNVADTRETTARRFVVARFARLWSVLVPAMALTIACDAIGRIFGPYHDSYLMSPIDHPLVRLAAALTFLSESWVSIQPFSDFAAWSLSIEFWYYAIFAAWMYAPPKYARWIAVGIAIGFSGHKGLLLLPIWLMGVALQRSVMLRRVGQGAGALFFFGGLLLFGWLLFSSTFGTIQLGMERTLGPWAARQLAEARAFPFDWLLGLSLAIHLAGARTVMNWVPLETFSRSIRWCAGISFAMYLFHMPLLHLFAAFLSRGQGLLGLSLTLGAIALLGPQAERSKFWWRRQLDMLVEKSPLRNWLPALERGPEQTSIGLAASLIQR